MPIIFTPESNLIEWVFSMQKLSVFVRGENVRAAEVAGRESEPGWMNVAKRVLVNCAHQTRAVDGQEILDELEKFAAGVFAGKVPVVKEEVIRGEMNHTWRDENGPEDMSIRAPSRIMEEARKFFRSSSMSFVVE